MLKLIRTAAIAATLAFAPNAALAHETDPAPGQSKASASAGPSRHAPRASRAPLAPGQSKADYYAWLARAPEQRAAVIAFRDRLAAERLDSIVPVWQLIRTSSSWRQCAAQPFEVAPADKWGNIAATLKFVRDEVEPAIGEVEALSAYRNEHLNACSAGAPKSAHRMFFALDLTPVSADVTRETMIGAICAAHARNGRGHATGLGFYSGRRFHVDSNGFRKWGPDGSGATSPCLRHA